MSRYADYDAFAWVYNAHWGHQATRVFPLLEKLLLYKLAPGARVLDLCCGTGQLAQALLARGYIVSGLDGSEEMLRFARCNAPGAQLILADARSFTMAPEHDAVVSTFDSLNHVMSLEELASVFRSVRGALHDGGWFLFDLNMEPGYLARWRGSFSIVEDDHVCVVRARYDAAAHNGRYDITVFRAADGGRWARSDLVLTQRCYSEAEVVGALEATGFAEIGIHDAQPEYGEVGRSFFLCQVR